MDAYSEAHLFVSGIRICEFKEQAAPTMEAVCGLLEFSVEHGHAVARRLQKAGVLSIMEDPFSVRLGIVDYLEIENFSRDEKEESSIEKELAAFQKKKKNMDAKVASIQAELEKKKKDMFADLEERFKQEMEKTNN